jgi:hypothetical protein
MECTWHKFAKSAPGTNLQRVHLAQISNKCTWHKFVWSAPGTNIYGVHLAQICIECTWHKFVCSAPGTNLQRVHLAQICMECTWHKFLISAPGTNFQTVHPAQICMECTWYKFARSALGTNSEICKPGTDSDTRIIIFDTCLCLRDCSRRTNTRDSSKRYFLSRHILEHSRINPRHPRIFSRHDCLPHLWDNKCPPNSIRHRC